MTCRRSWFFSLLILSLTIHGCSSDESNPVASIPVIPVPFNLGATVGANAITISWSQDASFEYSGFAIRRSEDDGATWPKIATVSSSPYKDPTVRTGVRYQYAVAGINDSGVEGKRSVPLSVVAEFYAVRINGGDVFTNTRVVELEFSAPNGTQLVRFSENPNLSGEPWQNYAETFPSVTLSAGDGPKFMFADFTDPDGFITDTVSDTIILDTESSITGAAFSPVSPVPVGVTLHFQVTPVGGELDGAARVSIETFPTTITALDDGTNGDRVMDDGVYETDVTMPTTFRGAELLVNATFTDAAGNVSAPFEFGERLTFTDPPVAVFLFPAEDSTTTSVSLRWSAFTDANFARYEIYRDQSPAVSRELSLRVQTIPTSTTTVFVDNSLQEAEDYYYVVYVVNDLAEYTASNVRLTQTADIPPTPVVLDEPSAIGVDRLTLTWSMNSDTDFQEYRVYRDTAPGVTTASELRTTISDPFQTFFDDSGLDTTSNTYYYRVYVADRGGNTSRSNETSTP